MRGEESCHTLAQRPPDERCPRRTVGIGCVGHVAPRAEAVAEGLVAAVARAGGAVARAVARPAAVAQAVRGAELRREVHDEVPARGRDHLWLVGEDLPGHVLPLVLAAGRVCGDRLKGKLEPEPEPGPEPEPEPEQSGQRQRFAY